MWHVHKSAQTIWFPQWILTFRENGKDFIRIDREIPQPYKEKKRWNCTAVRRAINSSLFFREEHWWDRKSNILLTLYRIDDCFAGFWVKFLLIITCCICLYLFHTIISFHQVYLNEAFQSTFGKTVLKIIWFSLISNFRRLMMVLFSFICCRIISITAAIYRCSTFMTITFQRSRILDLQATWLTYIFKKIK